MKKSLFLTVFFMLLTSYAFCQKNYQKAYVVTLKGDTVHGFINYRGWNSNPRHIGFRHILNGKKVIYKPLGIKSFYVHGEMYLSAIVKSRTSASATVVDSPKVNTTIDTVFLKVLARGSKGLLFYKSPMNIKNFYIVEGEKPVLLIYKKYIRAGGLNSLINSNSYIDVNRKYIGQLLVYLEDCPNLKSHINSANYSSKSLVNIFQNYYKCKNETPMNIQKLKKIKLKLGLFAGVTGITKLYVRGIDLTLNGRMGFKHSSNFCGGAVLDIILPGHLQEWSIHNEIEYMSSSGTIVVKNQPKGGYYTDFKASFGYSSIAINDLVRFTYSFGMFSAFANAGVSNGFVLNYTNHLETIHGGPNSSTPVIVEGNFANPSILLKNDLAPMAGIGLSYKSLDLEVRYERRIENTGEGLHNERTSVLLGYVF